MIVLNEHPAVLIIFATQSSKITRDELALAFGPDIYVACLEYALALIFFGKSCPLFFFLFFILKGVWYFEKIIIVFDVRWKEKE